MDQRTRHSSKDNKNHDEDSDEEAFQPKKRSVPLKNKSNKSTEVSQKKERMSESRHRDDQISKPSTSDTRGPKPDRKRLNKVDKLKIIEDPAVVASSSSINSDSSRRTNEMNFCPICQIPLKLLKISAEMHTASCNVPSNLKACPDGPRCLSVSTFHYRDYNHSELAAFRDSDDYVKPDVVFTPKKAKLKRTPLKASAGKKRSSKSPVAPSMTKFPKTEDTHPDSPDMFDEGNVDVGETRKRLSFSENLPPPLPHFEDLKTLGHLDRDCRRGSEQSSEISSLEHQSLHCSDLYLSAGSQCPEVSNVPFLPSHQKQPVDCAVASTSRFENNSVPNVKEELVSQGFQEENATAPSSIANVMIYYNMTVDGGDQNVTRKRIECSERCTLTASQSTVDSDELKATCSVVIKSRGMKKEEAMARSPISVNLMINSSGWEAVDVKGTSTASLKEVNVALCHCAHSLNIECCVSDAAASHDIKFDPGDKGHNDKFYATMHDLGLKRQQIFVQPLVENKNSYVEQMCHQISVSTYVESESHGTASRDEQDKADSEGSIGERELDGFEKLLDEVGENSHQFGYCDESVGRNERQGAAPGKKAKSGVNSLPVNKSTESPFLKNLSNAAVSTKSKRPASPASFLQSLNGKSRTSTPSPGPMVVTKVSDASWTLVPAINKSALAEKPQGNANRKVPAYKRIPDTQIVVDAFNFGVIPGVKAYFLSHFHSDHYIGLRKGFNLPIYCSKVTANLVHLKLGVGKEYLHVLKFEEPRVVCGVEIEIFDAFHCPGAVMFLFRLLDGRTFLHVGDFRAHPSMEEFPQLRNVDKLYLDTTYCDPAYNFPSQDEVVSKVIDSVSYHLNQHKATLFVCGSYTIGKEKVFMGIAEAFNFKIWTEGDKRRILHCLEDKSILDRLTNDPTVAQVHVLPMRNIALEELSKLLDKYTSKYTHVVGFKPTGWTTSKSLNGKVSDFQKSTRGKVTIYGVPYSEHSSFSELRRFVRHIKPKDIQVTVNVSKSNQYKKLFQQWLSNARDDSQSKMVQYFTSSSREPSR